MEQLAKTENDYAGGAERRISQTDILDKLHPVQKEIARHANDSAPRGARSQGRAKLSRTRNAAAKLKVHLAAIDPTTCAQLFGAGAIGSRVGEDIGTILGPRAALNADAVDKFFEFKCLLDQLIAKDRPEIGKSDTTEIDHDVRVKKWFPQGGVGDKLQSVMKEVARYANDSGRQGTPAQRKAKLRHTKNAAAKLKHHLAVEEPGAALNTEAEFRFKGLLDELIGRAGNLVSQIPAQSAGQSRLPDPISFGVECLAAIWKRYRPDEKLTSGQNRGNFGDFAEEIICAGVAGATRARVRTALRYYFTKTK